MRARYALTRAWTFTISSNECRLSVLSCLQKERITDIVKAAVWVIKGTVGTKLETKTTKIERTELLAKKLHVSTFFLCFISVLSRESMTVNAPERV